MTKKASRSIANYDYRQSAEYKFHQRAMAAFEKLSSKEKLQTMVDSGILSENYKLTRRYGGSAENSDPKES